MKIKLNVKVNMNIREVMDRATKAATGALKELTVDVAGDAIKLSPQLTGNNMRLIKYEAKGLEASVYSTSGYGGYLETGTWKMPARPYMKPALDMNVKKFPELFKAKL